MEGVAGQGEWLGGRQRERERRGDWVECTASERLKGKRKEGEERPPIDGRPARHLEGW